MGRSSVLKNNIHQWLLECQSLMNGYGLKSGITVNWLQWNRKLIFNLYSSTSDEFLMVSIDKVWEIDLRSMWLLKVIIIGEIKQRERKIVFRSLEDTSNSCRTYIFFSSFGILDRQLQVNPDHNVKCVIDFPVNITHFPSLDERSYKRRQEKTRVKCENNNESVKIKLLQD